MSPALLQAIIMWCQIAQLGPHSKAERFDLEKDCRQHLILCHGDRADKADTECFKRGKSWPKSSEEIL